SLLRVVRRHGVSRLSGRRLGRRGLGARGLRLGDLVARGRGRLLVGGRQIGCGLRFGARLGGVGAGGHWSNLSRRTSGRQAVRSARLPEAETRAVASASSQVRSPLASSSQVAGSVSTTPGGVPRVWVGPASAWTAPAGGTRTSSARPGEEI